MADYAGGILISFSKHRRIPLFEWDPHFRLIWLAVDQSSNLLTMTNPD